MSRRPYVRKISTTSWWLKRGSYTRYMIRELTSVFIGGYSALLMMFVLKVADGPAAYYEFLQAISTPGAVAVHVVALAFALYHTYTFFGVAPKALPIQIGTEKVPPAAIVAGHYAGMAVLSAAILILVLWR